MCLVVDKAKTKKIKKRDNRKIKIKKFLKFSYDLDGNILISTPYTGFYIDAGWLKADSGPFFIGSKLNGGAIHAYIPNAYKSNFYENSSDKMAVIGLNCWGYAKDFIAYGKNKDIAFSKIWIPIEEIERAIRLFKRNVKLRKYTCK